MLWWANYSRVFLRAGAISRQSRYLSSVWIRWSSSVKWNIPRSSQGGPGTRPKISPQFLSGPRGVNDSPWHLWRTASSAQGLSPNMLDKNCEHILSELLTRHLMSASTNSRLADSEVTKDKINSGSATGNHSCWANFAYLTLTVRLPLSYNIFNTFKICVREKLLYVQKPKAERKKGGRIYSSFCA